MRSIDGQVFAFAGAAVGVGHRENDLALGHVVDDVNAGRSAVMSPFGPRPAQMIRPCGSGCSSPYPVLGGGRRPGGLVPSGRQQSGQVAPLACTASTRRQEFLMTPQFWLSIPRHPAT